MDERWEELVRERAYRIWERMGSPDGHADQFWLMAEEELIAEGVSRPGAAPEPPPAAPVEDKVDEASEGIVPRQRSPCLDRREPASAGRGSVARSGWCYR